MGIFKKFVNQTRKPEGFLGKMMIKAMNKGHGQMADWAISRIEDVSIHEIVDLGCGGGRNAGELMKIYSSANLTAVDYSPLSVKAAGEYNRKMIEAKRCVVRQGDVSDLDLENNKYDLATAFETIYFWPRIEHCFSEVKKILKPDGVFMITNEVNGIDERGLKYEKIIEGMKIYTKEEIGRTLEDTGFSKIKMYNHHKKPWITIIARK